MHLVQIGAHHRRIGVLDQQRRDRRPAMQRIDIAGEDRPEPRLIEIADRFVFDVEPFDQGAIDRIDAGMAVERAAALVLPGAGDGGERGHRMHVHRAVARAREPVVTADEARLGATV